MWRMASRACLISVFIILLLRPFDALDDRRCDREHPDRDSCNGGF